MAAKQYKASLLIAEDEESLREALKLNMELHSKMPKKLRK
jgi:hypothetical protein